jgi:hypothetical protein
MTTAQSQGRKDEVNQGVTEIILDRSKDNIDN